MLSGETSHSWFTFQGVTSAVLNTQSTMDIHQAVLGDLRAVSEKAATEVEQLTDKQKRAVGE